jgi:hypothetical protein
MGGPKGERSQTWRTFLRNQNKGIWAADLFVDQTIDFQTLYVFFFIRHERRELIQCKVTASPTAAWIWRQVIEATAWGCQPKHVIRDRDNSYGADLGTKLAMLGIEDHKTPYRAPLANSVAERVVRTFRQECLDHIIVLNEQHLLTAHRVPRLLQPGPTSPHAGFADAGTQPTKVAWRHRHSTDSRRTSSRIRQGGMTDALLPHYNLPLLAVPVWLVCDRLGSIPAVASTRGQARRGRRHLLEAEQDPAAGGRSRSPSPASSRRL